MLLRLAQKLLPPVVLATRNMTIQIYFEDPMIRSVKETKAVKVLGSTIVVHFSECDQKI